MTYISLANKSKVSARHFSRFNSHGSYKFLVLMFAICCKLAVCDSAVTYNTFRVREV